MEQLSSQDKKELFMSMVERAKNGTLDMMRMTESKKYDEIYSKLENNNGPFGLVVGGITKDGKVSVYLAELMYKQLPSDMVGGSMISSLEFEESDLSDFLDRFYDMNNMEILNEFFKNQPDYVKNASLQEYKDNEYNSFYNRLVTLNGLDYLTQSGTKLAEPPRRDLYVLENGLEIRLKDDKPYIMFRIDGDAALYDITTGEFKKAFNDPKFGEYSSAFLQSVENLPRIYEAITKGTYRREDFMTEVQSQAKQTPLQQREAVLSALEAEAIRDTAELKEFESKEGQNIGE